MKKKKTDKKNMKTYIQACKEHQDLGDQEDKKDLQLGKTWIYVHVARRKTAEQEEGREATPEEDNTVFQIKGSSQENWSTRIEPRLAAWLTAHQQNQHGFAERSPSHMAKNPSRRSDQPKDYAELTPPNLRKKPRYDPNFSQMDSPSSESLAADVTIASTPKKKTQIIEGSTRRSSTTSMTQTRPDYQVYDDRQDIVRIPAYSEEAEGRQTSKRRSPSSKRRGNSKFNKKKTHRSTTFHYKLWKQMDKLRPPRFTRQQLSVNTVMYYTTETKIPNDTNRQGMESVMADGKEDGQMILLKIDFEAQGKGITKVIYLLDKTLGRDSRFQEIYIPAQALDVLKRFFHDIHKAPVQTLEQNQWSTGSLIIYRSKHQDWKAKAKTSLQKTTM